MKFSVCGGSKLFGKVVCQGSKNSALALLAASVLTDADVILTNCPAISDVTNMAHLLRAMGKRVVFQGNTVCVSGSVGTCTVPMDLCCKLRGSSLLLGGLAARLGCANLPITGGCAIGRRPMDVHTDGLAAMGVDCRADEGGLHCKGQVHGCNYTLRFPSVGGTENLLMAATLAKGTTELFGCATEPEVTQLAEFLTCMGARIEGIGTPHLTVCGTDSLQGGNVEVIPDRIVASTYLSAVAACGGQVTVANCFPPHLDSFLQLLKGRFSVDVGQNEVTLSSNGLFKGFGKVATAPYPGIPTDVQSLLLTLSALAHGNTQITENLYENRLAHNASQLAKMGATVTVRGNVARATGGKLVGASLSAADLRGGAALVVAALAADGQSEVCHAEHVLRGYCNLDGTLRSLGATVTLS